MALPHFLVMGYGAEPHGYEKPLTFACFRADENSIPQKETGVYLFPVSVLVYHNLVVDVMEIGRNYFYQNVDNFYSYPHKKQSYPHFVDENLCKNHPKPCFFEKNSTKCVKVINSCG